MKRSFNYIEFEELSEVDELLMVIDKYVKQNPSEKNNEKLKRFYYLLEEIQWTW